MNRNRLWPLVLTIALGLLASAPSEAQSLYNYRASILGGLGGSFDADPDPGYSNKTLQVGFSLALDASSALSTRLGRLDLDGGDGFSGIAAAELTYFTIGGEYVVQKPYYDSGLYLALGGYQLDGTRLSPFEDLDESAIGLAFGVTADFPINARFSILSELSGHYADLDDAQVFGMLHVGLAFHF